ncbi:hypothetical protein [Desulfobulbus elongatus]|uniref:hypothetical protein n=1 Tax=Desulfobulbus elongatus TaxID=53332 RepID=UPI000487F495|nr:hypothetical protein [Desulfobulbus elongatus]
MNRIGNALSDREKTLIYVSLCPHYGPSLCPDWPAGVQRELTAALDKLRLELYGDLSDEQILSLVRGELKVQS